ncbi:tripartite tricarboxylate transporter substrate binding protein [Bacillus sp. JJ1566]|uniref:tripartite tricarboxylate transporter substrate binding protein n=1 Tax=Bacillus sp. JJ1566 TaxID=3122961 RepID=UPI002FFE63E2
MKKIVIFLMITMLVTVLTACGGASPKTSSAKNKFPDKPITLIVSFAAGGGMDTGARILAPYLEKELGVPVTVVNRPGAAGWIGWSELANAKPDGYTIGYLGTPNIINGYLDPKQQRKENLESFTLIASHLSDPGVIAINNDETRFKDVKELMEYAKKNEVTITTTGVGSDDHIAALKLNEKFGTKFIPVHTEGSAKQAPAVMGGHIDVMFANVVDVINLKKTNDINVIAVLSEERTPFFDDVPTLKESGYEGVLSSATRGFAAPKGLDEEVLKVLSDAFEKAITNEEHIKKQADSGLAVDYKGSEAYLEEMKGIEQELIGIKSLLGWE